MNLKRVQHKLTNTGGRSGTKRGSIYGDGLAHRRLDLSRWERSVWPGHLHRPRARQRRAARPRRVPPRRPAAAERVRLRIDEAGGRTNLPPIRDNCRPARQPFIFPRKKTCTSPPMAGTPMQFPQCAMPLTTPVKRERLCCAVSPWIVPKRSESRGSNRGSPTAGAEDVTLESHARLVLLSPP